MNYFKELHTGKRRYIPASLWLDGYSLKIFGSDTIAGITLAAYAIPVSLAYATLAGLPPQYGIYGYLLGGIFYAMVGTSRHLAVGPTSAISLLIGTTISGMANGDIQRWADIASLTAFVFAALSVLAYLLRLSSIINFISENVLLGFKAGAAITIGLTQLPKLFAVPGGGKNVYERVESLILQLPQTNLYVFLFGLSAIALIYFGQKIFPGKPIAILIVIASIIIVLLTTIDDHGFQIVGPLHAGLPELYIPSLHINEIESVVPLAFACFLLAYVESVSAAKALAQKNGYEIDPRQELLAIGLANLATAFGHGYPISGGLSQSAVNDRAGAKTPMSLVMASLTIALCLLFLTGMLKDLPLVILAAIVLVAIGGLVDVKEFIRLFRVNRFDFGIAMVALISVVIFGILWGVVIAALASLLLIIRIVSNPHVAFLGRIPGTKRYTDLKRHPDNESIPGVLLFRVEAPLLYFNVSTVYNNIMLKIKSMDSSIKMAIFDLSTSAYIDSSGAKFIKKLYLDLHERGIALKICEAHSEVRDILRYEDIEHLIGHVSRRDSLDEIVNAVSLPEGTE
ncbi:MAG: SulP family inorganic anion transporter [Bacteroidia bacterium]